MMIEALQNFLEVLKRTYRLSKKELISGETEETIKRKKLQTAMKAFSNVDEFKKGYANGVIAFVVNEFKEEYRLSDDRVKYYREALRNIYETLISGYNIGPEQIEELGLFRNVLVQLELQLSLIIQEKRDKIDGKKELIANLMNLLESFEKGKDEITEEDLKIISGIENESDSYRDFKKEFYINAIKLNESKGKKFHVNFEGLIALLKEHGYNIKIEDLSAEEQEEILRNSDLNKIKEILSLMDNIGILNKLSFKNLTSILLYGNKERISKQYTKMSQEGTLESDIYYYPSIWIRRSNDTEELEFLSKMKNSKSENPLYDITKGVSYEEVKENLIFLNEKGFVISPENNTVAMTWNKTLKHNCSYSEILGIKPNIMSLQLKDKKLDNLLDGYLETEEITIILDGFPIELYDLKEKFLLGLWILKKQDKDGYSQITFGMKDGKRIVNPKFLETLNNKSSLEISDMAEGLGLFIPDMPNKALFDNLVESAGLVDIDNDYYGFDKIKELDHKNKMSPTTYVFGTNRTGVQIISRPKVLRIFGLLMQSGEVADEKEALLYALTYNSILDKESYELIKNSIGYTDKKSLIY